MMVTYLIQDPTVYWQYLLHSNHEAMRTEIGFDI